MYNEFFGFSEEPFNVTPDPRFLYLTPSHREALASMMYGIMERKGFISITGEVGTGKTTLIHTLLKKLSKQVRTVFIFNPHTDFDELLRAVLMELEIPIPGGGKAVLLRSLNENLIRRLSQNENVALIIDEAQNLAEQTLEELRLLSNLETPESKLLQIVLVGQPELEAKLDTAELTQLKQRIGIRRKIEPLPAKECEKYIDHRLKRVGGSASKTFTKEAIAMISGYGKGIPRRINTICDNAFLIGYGLSKKRIDGAIVREALKDLGEGSSLPLEPGEFNREAAEEVKVGEPTPLNRRTESRSRQLFVLGFFLLVGFALLLFLGRSNVKRTEPPPKAPLISVTPEILTTPPSTQVNAEPTPPSVTSPVTPTLPANVEPLKESPSPSPEIKGQVISARSKDSIFLLARRYYHASNETLADLILSANPEIENIHQIRLNQEIKIPEISEDSLIIQGSDNDYRIHLGTFPQRRSVRIFEQALGLKGKELEFVPIKVAPQETWYRVLAGRFDNREECLKVIRPLRKKGLLPVFGSQLLADGS